MVIGISGILSISYVRDLGALGLHRALREIPGMKIYIIALVWMMVTVFFPFSAAHGANWMGALAQGFAVFFFIVGLTIPFDIRDKNFDQIGLQTLPQVFGTKRAKIVAFSALFLAYGIWVFVCPRFWLLFAVFWLLANLFVWYSGQGRHTLYYTFGIDGLIFLQGISLLLYTRFLP